MRAWVGTSILALALLAPSVRAHFPEDQIYILNGTFDSVIQVDPSSFSHTPIYGPVDGLAGASAVTFTAHGNMLIANSGDSAVLEKYSKGLGRVVLDDLDGLQASSEKRMTLDGYGWLYVASDDGTILKARPDWLVSWVFADSSDGVVNPSGMDFDLDGNMLVANQGSGGQVLLIDSAGNASVFDTIPGEDPVDIKIRRNQDIFVACASGNVFQYPGGVVGGRVLLGSYGGAPSMDFNVDHSALYLVSRTTKELLSIDPDTGTSNVELGSAGWDPRGIAVGGAHMPPGSYRAFGYTGLPGTGGYVPHMDGDGNPRPGGTIRINMHDFVGWTQGFLVVGIGRAAVPFFGGELAIDTTIWWDMYPIWMPGNPGIEAEGDFETLTFMIPNDPRMVSSNWYFQAWALDSAASGGVSMSHGLNMWVGQ